MSNLATNDTAAMAMRLLGGSHDLSNISVLRANSGGYLSEPAIDLGDSWTRDGLYLGGAITFTLDEAARLELRARAKAAWQEVGEEAAYVSKNKDAGDAVVVAPSPAKPGRLQKANKKANGWRGVLGGRRPGVRASVRAERDQPHARGV